MHGLLRCPGPADRVSGGEGWSLLQSASLSGTGLARRRSDGTLCRAESFVAPMTEGLRSTPTVRAQGLLSPSFGQVRQ
jgi:hypothetical protein